MKTPFNILNFMFFLTFIKNEQEIDKKNKVTVHYGKIHHSFFHKYAKGSLTLSLCVQET